VVSFVVHAEPAAAVNWPLWIGAAVALLALAGILGTRRPPLAAKIAGVGRHHSRQELHVPT
jgi:LPXTG-motif cell wall-anchored protein